MPQSPRKKPSFEHGVLLVACFIMLFSSFLFLSSSLRATSGSQVVGASATVLPTPYNTGQKIKKEDFFSKLAPETKFILGSISVLILIILILFGLLTHHKPRLF